MVKTLRVAICGCTAVGKTFVLNELLKCKPQSLSEYEYCHTLEDVYVYPADKDLECRLYDTSGIDADNLDESIKNFIVEHESILSISEAIILVYSVDDGEKSFRALDPLVKAIESANLRNKEPYLYMLLGLKLDACEDESTETLALACRWKQQEKQIVLCREMHLEDFKSLQETFTCFISEAAMGQGVNSDTINSSNVDAISFRSLRDRAGRILHSVIRKSGDTTANERKAEDQS